MEESRIHITQGEFATSSGDDTVITTILGSCVACCMWDPVAKVGGMNHMLLASSNAQDARSELAGVNAMELLINELIKKGALRSRLQAKAFGGARMISGLSDIGDANAAFTLQFLADENIECVGHSLGGTQARNVRFWPGSGRVMQKMTGTPPVEEPVKPAKAEPGNDLELF